MTDFTKQFNTQLTPEELQQFNLWANEQPRNIDNEKYDYDIQGWYKENPGVNLSDAHLTDKFKKPNHPTFSDQSQYHGKNGLEGGAWKQLPDGSYSFIPGATNLEHYKPEELQDYFKKVEPGNKLLLQNFKLTPVPFNPFEAKEKMLQDRANTNITTIDPGTHWDKDKNVIMPEDITPSDQENI